MRKFLYMTFGFFRRNRFLSVLVALELIAAAAVFSYVLTKLQYCFYAEKVYCDTGLDAYDHYTSNEMAHTSDPHADSGYESLPERFGGIADVAFDYSFSVTRLSDARLNNFDDPYSIMLVEPDFLSRLGLDIAKGEWFGAKAAEDGIPQAVLAGSAISKGDNIGDILKFVKIGGTDTETVFACRLTGVLDYPGYFPDFQFMTTALTAQQLLAQNGNVVIIADTPDAREALAPFNAYRYSSLTAFVKYKDGITDSELAATRKALAAEGTLITREMILENTRAYTKSQLNTFLPIAIFLLVIATFGLISSVAVTIYKMSGEFAVYYLCGASARRCFGYSAAAIGILTIVGFGLNFGYLVYARAARINDPIIFGTGSNAGGIINGTTFALLGAYIIVAVSLAFLIAYSVFRSNSPVRAYTRARV